MFFNDVNHFPMLFIDFHVFFYDMIPIICFRAFLLFLEVHFWFPRTLGFREPELGFQKSNLGPPTNLGSATNSGNPSLFCFAVKTQPGISPTLKKQIPIKSPGQSRQIPDLWSGEVSGGQFEYKF